MSEDIVGSQLSATEEFRPRGCVLMSIYSADKPVQVLEACSSVLEQSFGSFLFLINIDGPIRRDVEDVLGRLLVDSRVRVFWCENNKGLAHSLNFLIEEALKVDSIEYFFRMDADDISMQGRFQTQVDYMDNNVDIDVLGSFCKEFGGSSCLAVKQVPTDHQSIVSKLIDRCPLIHPTVVFRRSVFAFGIRYPISTTFSEDLALWHNLAISGFRFANCPHSLLDFRLSDAAVKRRFGFAKAHSELVLRLKYVWALKKISFVTFSKIILKAGFHTLPASIGVKFFRFRGSFFRM